MDHEQAVYNIRTYKMKKAYILKAGVSVNLYLLNTNSDVCLTQMRVTTTSIPGRDLVTLSSSIPYSGKFSREHKFLLSPCIQTC